jgi:ribosomal protein L14
MKIQVIGSEIKGEVIQGKVKAGQLVVIRHRGKVKKGVIVRTKQYNNFMVSYDNPALIILGETNRVKGPISKGMKEEIRALCNNLGY